MIWTMLEKILIIIHFLKCWDRGLLEIKKEAIEWSWKLLHEVWGIPRDRLYATYFEGAPEQGVPADEEAKAEWLKYLPADKILPGNMKESEL